MQQYAVTPRLLADDLHLLSTGERHLDHSELAGDKTHLHLEDMGARIAPQKNTTFSSYSTAREWLRKHQWRRLGMKVPVVNDCMDVGARFNTTQGKMVGTTLTQRMRQTASSAGRLEKHKAPYAKNVEMIRAKKPPMGLYGCELAPVNESAMRTLRSAIASCLTSTNSGRSVDLTFPQGQGDQTLTQTSKW